MNNRPDPALKKRAQVYEERLFQFKDTSPAQVGDAVLKAMSPATKTYASGTVDRGQARVATAGDDYNPNERGILFVADGLAPRFVVAVKVHRLPGFVSPVRALVGIVRRARRVRSAASLG